MFQLYVPVWTYLRDFFDNSHYFFFESSFPLIRYIGVIESTSKIFSRIFFVRIFDDLASLIFWVLQKYPGASFAYHL